MANYRTVFTDEETEWCLVSPKNLFEVIKLAWYIWKYPDKSAVFMGIDKSYRLNLKE